MYEIQPYTYEQASKLGVIILLSSQPNKKLDIFDKRDKQYITSIEDIRYGDYPTYLKILGKDKADKRRVAFHNNLYSIKTTIKMGLLSELSFTLHERTRSNVLIHLL